MSIAGSEFWRGTILRRFFKSSTAVAAALVAMLVFTSAEAQAKTRALSNAERLIVEKAIKDTLVDPDRSEEHTSELQSLMRNSYAVFCLKKKKNKSHKQIQYPILYIQRYIELAHIRT